MDTLYRIHTEATTAAHEAAIHALVSPYFDAYNVTYGEGSWRGVRERSATIEVYGYASDRSKVTRIAQGIKAANNQEAILVSVSNVTAHLF